MDKDAFLDDDLFLFQQFLDVQGDGQVVDVGQGVRRRACHRVDEGYVLDVDAHVGEGLEQLEVGLAELYLTVDELRGIFLDLLGEPARRGDQ